MSRHPQRQPPPGYFVGPFDLLEHGDCGWYVYHIHTNLDGFLITDVAAGPYTRRYNAIAAAQRAYDRSQQAEQEKQP